MIGVSRFVDGISWGYSSLLPHKELDDENRMVVKVLFNFMVRLKRFFIATKKDDFLEIVFEDMKEEDNSFSEYDYVMRTSN